MPDQLDFPAGPLGSCFRLLATCGCGRVARLRLITHFFESCRDASSIFWFRDASRSLLMDTYPNLRTVPVLLAQTYFDRVVSIDYL